MNPRNRLSRRVGAPVLAARYAAAYRMVEDQNAVGAGGVFQKVFSLRIVNAPHLLFVIEVANGGRTARQVKALRVERNVVDNRPHVADRQDMRLVDDGRARR